MRANVAKDQRILDIDELRLAAGRRDDLIIKYAPLVKRVADRMGIRTSSAVSKKDLISAGIVGLIDALNKFDSTMGVRFEVYAWSRIKGAILDELRKMDWTPRSVRKEIRRIKDAVITLNYKLGRKPDDLEIAREIGVDIHSYHQMIRRAQGVRPLSLDMGNQTDSASAFLNQAAESPSAFDDLTVKERKNIISEALSKLSSKEQLVIALYYYEELNLKEIAKVLGVTESRVSQIHSKALIRLGVKLKSYHKEITPNSADKGASLLKNHVLNRNHTFGSIAWKRSLEN